MRVHPNNNNETRLKAIDDLIAHHEEVIKSLRITRNLMLTAPPPEIYFFSENEKLTKDLIRIFMRQVKNPMRTVQVIDILYPNASQEEKDKAVKTLSVIFNTLEKDGQIKVEKTPGEKGNLYTWIEK